jgi:hypothetical protein
VGSYLGKDEIRELVQQNPEYKDGRLSKDEFEEIVEKLYSDQDTLVEEYLKAEVRRELMRMAARGEVEYDPDLDAWRKAR